MHADPVYWCLHVLRSQQVHVSQLSIRGDWDIPNNDGKCLSLWQ